MRSVARQPTGGSTDQPSLLEVYYYNTPMTQALPIKHNTQCCWLTISHDTCQLNQSTIIRPQEHNLIRQSGMQPIRSKKDKDEAGCIKGNDVTPEVDLRKCVVQPGISYNDKKGSCNKAVCSVLHLGKPMEYAQ